MTSCCDCFFFLIAVSATVGWHNWGSFYTERSDLISIVTGHWTETSVIVFNSGPFILKSLWRINYFIAWTLAWNVKKKKKNKEDDEECCWSSIKPLKLFINIQI